MSDVKGLDQVMRRLERLAKQMPNEVARALYEELQIERQESMRRTPVDTGALRGSHEVSVEQTGRDIVGRITVGGVAAPYAIWVHENLEAFHPVGEAKFLERTILESKPFLARRIAHRIDLYRAVNG
jgi:hypothetical protein